MEEYLQYMKTLRAQMNDVEDQTAKISVEEQTHLTTIQTTEKDLISAKSETKQLKEEIELMITTKGQICAQILERQKKIASLESDSSTLAQTLELIQQERVSLSSKLAEKSAYYVKVADDFNSKLQQQQDWFNSQKTRRDLGDHGLVTGTVHDQTAEIEEAINDSHVISNLDNDMRENLEAKLNSARAKLDEVAKMKSKLVSENIKMKKSIEQVKCLGKDCKAEMLKMDINTLEEEYKALLSDKAGESEYLQFLEYQIEKLKGISHVIKCSCGVEYKVEIGN